MLRFAANLTMMYTEHLFPERFEAAARDGFTAVEYLFPYPYPAAQLVGLLQQHNLQQVLINAPAGVWERGERGLACLPGRETEFRAGIDSALAYAQALECPRIHVMSGIAPADTERSALRNTYMANVRWAAEQVAGAGRDMLLEPINPRDMPGYFLNRQDEAHAIVAEIGNPRLKVQMDLYHCRMVEGNVAILLEKYLDGAGTVGHMQVAGVPGRHEPDTGDLDFNPLFAFIEQSGYQGWVGCEYIPVAGTSAGLGWLRNRNVDSVKAAQ